MIVLPIYAASEEPIPGVTAERLAERIQGPRVEFAPEFATAVSAVAANAREGDLILTLGAGSVSQLGPADPRRAGIRRALILFSSSPTRNFCFSLLSPASTIPEPGAKIRPASAGAFEERSKMTASSRRGFLKIASATAAASAVLKRIPAWADTAQASGPVQVWSTFRDRRHTPGDPLAWKPVVQVAPDAIALDPSSTRQEILGFGAALTDASCYLLSQLRDDDRAALMHEIFSPGEMALNVCRTCIGSSDYSRSVYSFDDSDEDDPELKKFSIDHDKAYILPVLRDARKLNPDLFLFSSPWSPPGWMKFNRSMLGGTIRKSSLEPYSRYILKFLDAYKAEGVAIDAITMQNEVDTTVDGRYPACQWSQEDEILFVRKFLGPLMRSAGCTTKIWVLDHNFNLWGRAIGELSNAAAYQYH